MLSAATIVVLFFKGFAIGLAVAAPVGPVAVLCMQRTLSGGVLLGVVSGLGVAVADGLYGLLAASGLMAIAALLLESREVLRLLGGFFLILLGLWSLVRAGRRSVARGGGGAAMAAPAAPGNRTLAAAFFSCFLITLGNPATILSFLAIFAGLGLGDRTSGPLGAGLLVGGVFLGSAAWWLFLSALIGLLAGRLSQRAIRRIEQGAGLVIVAFGLAALIGL